MNKILTLVSLGHIFLLALSNVLVQYPFEVWGYYTTWGAFTYPAIFILTDLTTRMTSAKIARKIIFRSMMPGLLISYGIASYIENGHLYGIHWIPLRIALACFIAYVMGQLVDILVFQRYRDKAFWWLAPTLSASVGNVIDTVLFFSIAFYHCSHLFLAQHWPEIAMIDVFFKISISLLAFVPIYGLVLNIYQYELFNRADNR